MAAKKYHQVRKKTCGIVLCCIVFVVLCCIVLHCIVLCCIQHPVLEGTGSLTKQARAELCQAQAQVGLRALAQLILTVFIFGLIFRYLGHFIKISKIV